jgi:hypothetical protein
MGGSVSARQSDQRFRSFAERFMIERAAKRAYKQIEAVGRSITEEL